MKKTILICVLTWLLLLSFWGGYELHRENEYYKEVITALGSEELIEYPELYSAEYVEQINVHNCMWAFDVCSCEE